MVAQTRNLTDAFIAAVKPTPGKQVEYPDGKTSGLALRVSEKGKKSWTFRFRTAEGRQRRLSLGTYPATDLAKARRKAEDARGECQDGKDPVQLKREQKVRAGLKKIRTVADLAADYFMASQRGRHRAEALPKRDSTLALERDYFERLLKPKFGSLAIDELLRPDLQHFLDEIAVDSPSAARQCRNIIRQMYNYAIRRELTDRRNPAQFTDAPKSKSRERVLTDAEVKAVWSACSDPASLGDVDLSPTLALAIRLLMVTLQRGSEVCGATLSEFDLNARTWTIPGARTKNHRTHVVPLPDVAVSLVEQALALPVHRGSVSVKPKPDTPIFTVSKSGKPVTRHALTRAMKRITTHLQIKDATPHDFRRTGSTAMTSERLGVPRFHVSCVLNHISDTGGAAAVTAVYDRNAYLSEKRRALDKWAGRLHEIISDEPSDANVINLRDHVTL